MGKKLDPGDFMNLLKALSGEGNYNCGNCNERQDEPSSGNNIAMSPRYYEMGMTEADFFMMTWGHEVHSSIHSPMQLMERSKHEKVIS